MPPGNPNWYKGMPPAYRGGGSRMKKNLLSVAYKAILGTPLSEDIKAEFNMEDGQTWAELIALTVVKRAVGKVPDDKICFKAITELRETTEGKTPDKVIAAGSNEELANLARIMNGEPAPTEEAEPEPGEVAFGEDGEPINPEEK